MASIQITNTNNGSENAVKKSAFIRLFSFTNIFTLLVIAAVALGWDLRNEYWISPENGLGYALGITGGSMMLMLLLYPLRKRWHRNPFFILSTKNWFKLHMILGVLGPLLILYHCNFKLGSSNSNVALLAMGLMVLSGLIGRYIYSKIHASLFGKKMEVADLLKQHNAIKKLLDEDAKIDNLLLDNLYQYGEKIAAQSGVVAVFLTAFSLNMKSRRLQRNLIKELKGHCLSKHHLVGLDAKSRKKYFYNTKNHIQQYVMNTRRIARLSFYERLFSMWHLLHLPIFFMLIVTAFIHVYAVHVY